MLGPIVTTASASSPDTTPRITASAPSDSAPRVSDTVEPATTGLNAKQARAAVLTLVPKARVIAVRASAHGGYHGFAVKVERTDGSTLIGYIDSASGVVFDWSQPTAPAVQHSTSQSSANGNPASDDDSDDGQYGDDDSDDGQYGDDDSDDGQYGDDDSHDSDEHDD
jgi:hypothetical protein